MAQVIASVPTSFDLPPFAGRWFRWAEVSACFWPGRGARAAQINAELAPVRFQGGVYCFAWSSQPPVIIGPRAAEVKYIGESGEFQRRMGQFGNSAGFFEGGRQDGHSAAWRWPLNHIEDVWVSFFVVGEELLSHLAEGLRHWLEAVALEEFRLLYNRLPDVNEATAELEGFMAKQCTATDRHRD
jgi:hypothetical protein